MSCYSIHLFLPISLLDGIPPLKFTGGSRHLNINTIGRGDQDI